MIIKFKNRKDAGRQLAHRLRAYTDQENTLVLALPRGGAVVAHEVARLLHLPLSVGIIKKCGTPCRESIIGAIATALASARAPAHRREDSDGRTPLSALQGKTVILIDDGIATGTTTLQGCLKTLRDAGAREIIVAAPAGSVSACHALRKLADHVICLYEIDPFYNVNSWYSTHDDPDHDHDPDHNPFPAGTRLTSSRANHNHTH